MYTYVCAFVGVPLSQLFINTELKELGDIVHETMVRRRDIPRILVDCQDELSSANKNLLNYIQSIDASLTQLEQQYGVSINFSSAYHGSDDAPVIFGAYVDKLFHIPDFGCKKLDMSGVITIQALQKDMAALFQGYPGVFPIDFYANNHSS